jgi:hypothetical protein
VKVAIEVRNRDEASLLKAAMSNDTVRAYAMIVGALMSLANDDQRRSVLAFVQANLKSE